MGKNLMCISTIMLQPMSNEKMRPSMEVGDWQWRSEPGVSCGSRCRGGLLSGQVKAIGCCSEVGGGEGRGTLVVDDNEDVGQRWGWDKHYIKFQQSIQRSNL
jgi:hypothetical protein